MPEGRSRRIVKRARTAAGLPGRVVAVEDRSVAIEDHVAASLDAMREELVEVRSLLRAVLETEGDLAGLIGRLLSQSAARLDALEAGPAPGAGDHDGAPGRSSSS